MPIFEIIQWWRYEKCIAQFPLLWNSQRVLTIEDVTIENYWLVMEAIRHMNRDPEYDGHYSIFIGK